MSDSLTAQLQASLGAAYTIERELGGGGMSRVFLATEAALDRQVVIKLLPPELVANVSTERFKREIHLAARLQHPHIVPVHAAGDANGIPYFTMPYVEGESLRVRLAKHGEMPVSEAMRVMREIASALAYAHAHGIVHRDIKPDNVMLSGGSAMVTDFGVAKALSASSNAENSGMTSLGVALGTPAYMAPEQASADPTVDNRADVYAFGILAYEILTGQTPFGGRTPQGLLAAHVTEPPEPIQKRRTSLPPALAALVMRCLEKRPADRPQTADEIVHALDDLTTPSGGMLPTSAVMSATTAVPPPKRNTIAIAAGIVVTLLLLGGAAYAWRGRGGVVATADAATPLTLAVLPFENAGSMEQASFTDGLTDALTAKLSALPNLAVIERRSAAQYRGTTKPPRQIGKELGVQYLLEGVVRWAKDRSGAWRAQVTPELVDARTGTTKWTGEPVVVTPDDPFTAQGSIATSVVQALRLALHPTDRAELTRAMTSNPAAFAAYERGRAILVASERTNTSPSEIRRAAGEFTRAVTLDSTFAEAWFELAGAHDYLANLLTGQKSAEALARTTYAHARARAPGDPRVLLGQGFFRARFDHDTTGLDALVREVLTSASNDTRTLLRGASWLYTRHQFDSAYALAVRAATLDPRSATTLAETGYGAVARRRWADALHYAEALITLDSTDERGWSLRGLVYQARGDTLNVQRELARAMEVIPHPSVLLLSGMAYAGNAPARRYLTLSARELGVATLFDSVWVYFDVKADACAQIGDQVCERAYYDSIRTLLAKRALSGGAEAGLLSELALAQAAVGRLSESRQTLDRMFALARGSATRADQTGNLDATIMGGLYARLGQPDSAITWLEKTIANPVGRYTAQGLAVNPKLRVLHGTPAFEQFLRAHPQ